MALLVIILTFFVSVFAFSQIFGSLIYKIIVQKQYTYLLTIIIWTVILYLYYIMVNSIFSDFLQYYIVVTVISAIISLLSSSNNK